MRNITIDFTNAPPVISDRFAGEKGEHQATTLNIIPETNMSDDTDIAFYYVLFKVEGGLVASRTFSQGEDISIALWGQLLEDRRLTFQLIGTNGLESIISKTPILTLYLGDSLEGTVIGIDDNRDSLIALIGGFNERLEEVEGEVSSLDSEVIKAIKKADGTLLTVTDNSVTLPDYALSSDLAAKENKANKTNTISSSSTNTKYPSAKAVYDFVTARSTDITGMTGNEIRAAWGNNRALKYSGFAIISVQDYTYNSTEGVVCEYSKYEYTRNDNQILFYCVFVPNTDTTITDATSLMRTGITLSERMTGGIGASNIGFVKGGQVYEALLSYYTRTEIDNKGFLTSIPTASTSTLGGVKVDGTSITINDGVISSSGGGGGASAVIVNFSMENDDLVADKTIAEIYEAYDNGSIVLGKLADEDMGIELVYQLNVCFAEEGYAFCEFYSVFNDGGNNVLNFAIIGFNEGEDDTWVSETPLAIPKAGQIQSGDTGYATGGDVYTALSSKQDTLTFDSTPTQNSTNPVTSGGLYTVIGNVEAVLAELIGGN